MRKYYWVSKDGRFNDVDEMDVNHLRNIVKMWIRKMEETGEPVPQVYPMHPSDPAAAFSMETGGNLPMTFEEEKKIRDLFMSGKGSLAIRLLGEYCLVDVWGFVTRNPKVFNRSQIKNPPVADARRLTVMHSIFSMNLGGIKHNGKSVYNAALEKYAMEATISPSRKRDKDYWTVPIIYNVDAGFSKELGIEMKNEI